MTNNSFSPEYDEFYEYHGNTTIELTRRQGEITVWRDWINFDTVREAAEYFNEHCSTGSGSVSVGGCQVSADRDPIDRIIL